MCGIFGILTRQSDSLPDQDCLDRSVHLMKHRGPDFQNTYVAEGIGLAHTRLSLVDVNPRSDQPFWDRERRYGLVFNGEIYNFRELRGELERQGIQFTTTGDTEVLLESLIHKGVQETLRSLEGMFAFALYDKRERLLTLARDRFGIKPLYVYDQENVFIFASEVAAMRPWIRFEPDLLSISSYLQGTVDPLQEGPMSGFSFFKHLRIVQPGSLITVRAGRRAETSHFLKLTELWDEAESDRLEAMKPGAVVDQLEEALLRSMEMQLAADVPVGALCSGGVDSSVIMAMARKFHNNLAIFHADVVSDSEYDAAAALARHLALDLKTVKVVDQDFIELMPEVMEHYGHPYSLRPNAVPILLVSKLVRSCGIKAVLTGEGSDECFVGYPYNMPNVARFMHELPLRAYHALPRLSRRLFTGDIRGWIDELRAFRPKASRDYRPGGVQIGSLQNRFEREMEYEEICSESARIKRKQPGAKEMISLEQMSYELRTLLHRNDSQGMAASVECRFPFLDSRVVKLAVNMPYRYKVRFSPTTLEREHLFLRDKWVLRQVADRYLPRSLSRRKKVGFPTDTYRRTRIADEFFEDSLVADLFELDRKAVHYLTGHAGEALKRKLLHVEVWAHVCLRGTPRHKIAERLRSHIAVRPR